MFVLGGFILTVMAIVILCWYEPPIAPGMPNMDYFIDADPRPGLL